MSDRYNIENEQAGEFEAREYWNSQPSPGPWDFDGDPDDGHFSIWIQDENEANKYGDIAHVNANGLFPATIAHANAKLMAAAPDLLAALKMARVRIESGSIQSREGLMTMINNAINKAE